MTTTVTAPSRNTALIAARVAAGLLGGAQLAAASFFTFIAPEDSVWVGLWIDVPIVALIFSTALLKLGIAVLPGLPAARRIALGFVAFPIGIAVTIVKMTAYSEPEGINFLIFDTVLLVLLLLARRSAPRR